MNQPTTTPDSLRDIQIPIAFSSLQSAVTEYVEDLNARFNAGFAIRCTQTTFEVHELEKGDALVSVSLTGENDIQYSRFIKRDKCAAVGRDLRPCLQGWSSQPYVS